ncbi:MAG: hypothetical protein KatS3mg043_2079 [Rhodothermaceae bacterium]|nr:MAG: hypothetical protein KatS3mg043_2079 [Rhodothermaceae bacterium]
MIMTAQEKKQPVRAGCPIIQMTVGEVIRYLQGGYEPPVQRAIDKHVRFCNTCAAELERVRALRGIGRHLMQEHLYGAPEEDPAAPEHLDEVRLAAFVEGTLAPADQEAVRAHIIACYTCYQQYAAAVYDLETPVTAAHRTPQEALQLVLAPETTAPPSLLTVARERLHTLWRRLTAWSEQVFGGPLRAPALALALGMLAVLLVFPLFRTSNVISLQTVQQAIANPDQVMSGRLPGATLRNDVLVITGNEDEEIVFTWPDVGEQRVSGYRVRVYDDENRRILEQDVPENAWAVTPAVFAPGVTYTLNVVAFYEEGGVRPVIRTQKIQRVE